MKRIISIALLIAGAALFGIALLIWILVRVRSEARELAEIGRASCRERVYHPV